VVAPQEVADEAAGLRQRVGRFGQERPEDVKDVCVARVQLEARVGDDRERWL
jgi:hypothetical protein